jgi:hypothetical protein
MGLAMRILGNLRTAGSPLPVFTNWVLLFLKLKLKIIIKRWHLGCTFSILQLGAQRGASTGGMPNVPKTIADMPYQCGSLKKRKTCERCP